MKMPLQLTEEQKEAIDSRGQEIKDLSEQSADTALINAQKKGAQENQRLRKRRP